MTERVTLEEYRNQNITTKDGKTLIKISVKNEKNEELQLKDIFTQITEYTETNYNKVESTAGIIAAYATGPYPDLNRAFINGYLFAKFIEKLEEQDKCKYSIDYVERPLDKLEAKYLMADFLEEMLEQSKKAITKLRAGKEIDDEDENEENPQ